MPNPNISQLLSTTMENQLAKVVDNIAENNIIFNKLRERGRILKQSGGTTFRETLSYAENGTIQSQGQYDTYDTTPQDVITSADFDQKIITGTITMTDLEAAQNKGKEQIIPLMKAKMDVLKTSFDNYFGDQSYGDGTGSGGLDLGGLALLVADDPTTGTVGGINRATSGNEFWRNQLYDFSVESVTPSATTIQSAMNALYRRCQTQGGQLVDLITAGDTYFGYYEDSLQANQRFNDGKLAKLGFDALKYKAADVVYDTKCTDEKMYFLNTRFLSYKYIGEQMMSVGSATRPHNQGVTVVPMTSMGNLTITNAKVHGVMIA
jgi:hypothetical protein